MLGILVAAAGVWLWPDAGCLFPTLVDRVDERGGDAAPVRSGSGIVPNHLFNSVPRLCRKSTRRSELQDESQFVTTPFPESWFVHLPEMSDESLV